MANERKTEDIVRTHFKNDPNFNNICFEEQISDSPKIKKLLENASKSGNGLGKPEFIISKVLDCLDLLIVIECKSDVNKHESQNRNNPKEYAVDGVIHYSDYLSKQFDVLSIAVSGIDKSTLKINHFLQLKGSKNINPVFGDELISISSYFEGYIKSEEKTKQEYEKLLDYSKKLNEKLHEMKIGEANRSYLISAILIALENSAFKVSYFKKNTGKNLAKFLIDTAVEELQHSNIDETKLEDLKASYAFIQTADSLTRDKIVLSELIKEIDEEVNSFMKTYKFYDILGQFYTEFLGYSNNDKGLGIVLTPMHITDFFSQILEVNKNSVVYDNCTGTGGFLISAMKHMIIDAKDELEKIADIKNNQLIGVEFQSNIFSLVCSNMILHGDGKTNILKGSCFDEQIILKVKNKKPNIGMLNPPYDSNEELKFILNNLSVLEVGGKCAAIVPLSCATATSETNSNDYIWKEQLLKDHTLEAVFSMPDQLFYNSKTATVTCIIIFTAHIPHPNTKKTFFGYFKDDGHYVKRHKGRKDWDNLWKEKLAKWINLYRNREIVPELSVMKCVSANDEWCAEAYLETDYSNLSVDDFKKTIKDYLVFQFLNEGDI